MAYCIVIQTLNKTETGVYHLCYQLVPGDLTAAVANFRRCVWRYLRRIRYYKRQ